MKDEISKLRPIEIEQLRCACAKQRYVEQVVKEEMEKWKNLDPFQLEVAKALLILFMIRYPV